MVFAFLCVAQPTGAATITVEPATAAVPALILVDGTLVADDIDQFRTKATGISKAVVIFRSDGGSLAAGIRIGQMIRLRNWFTLVGSNTRCASACAIAWLGGTRRFIDPTAQIGFHAAYVTAGGQITETGAGNAVLGNYLGQLGLSENAILYITGADPRSMQWLSSADATAYGIEIETLPPAISEPPPARNPPAPERSLEARTAGYVNSIMKVWSNWSANWSDGNQQAIKTLQSAYGPQVSYYGKQLSRQEVLADKQKFIERWQQRKYEIRAQSVAASCDTSRVCTVTGTVDYYVTRDPTATVHSQGSAQFEYRVLWTNQGPSIVHETSKVISRQTLERGTDPAKAK